MNDHDPNDTQPVNIPGAAGRIIGGKPKTVPTREQITAHEKSNDARLAALAQQVPGLQFDIIGVKLECILQTLFGGPDAEARRAFDDAMAASFTEKIEEAEAEVRKMLIRGRPPQGLIVPNGAAVRRRPVRDAPQA